MVWLQPGYLKDLSLYGLEWTRLKGFIFLFHTGWRGLFHNGVLGLE